MSEAKTKKLTPAQVQFFIECVRKWSNKFNLGHWSIYVVPEEVTGYIAYTSLGDYGDFVATLVLNVGWDANRELNNNELDRLAFHEVTHVLLGEMHQLGDSRDSSGEARGAAWETTVRRIENFVWGGDIFPKGAAR